MTSFFVVQLVFVSEPWPVPQVTVHRGLYEDKDVANPLVIHACRTLMQALMQIRT